MGYENHSRLGTENANRMDRIYGIKVMIENVVPVCSVVSVPSVAN